MGPHNLHDKTPWETLALKIQMRRKAQRKFVWNFF